MEAHWEGYNSDETDEKCEYTDNEDEADLEAVRNAFNVMMLAAEGKDAAAKDNYTIGLYQRGLKFSERHERRKRAASNASKRAAKYCKTLDEYSFIRQSATEPKQPIQAADYTDPKEQRRNQLCLAINDMKKLKSRELQKTWHNQNLTKRYSTSCRCHFVEAILTLVRKCHCKLPTVLEKGSTLREKLCGGKAHGFVIERLKKVVKDVIPKYKAGLMMRACTLRYVSVSRGQKKVTSFSHCCLGSRA
jgi:hypothetical protein